MRYAANKDGFIENVIVAGEEQKEELESGLGVVLEDASIYGLQIGDLWVDDKGWTRNINGEQVILEPLTQDERSQYQTLCDEIDVLTQEKTALEEENAALLFENLTGEAL